MKLLKRSRVADINSQVKRKKKTSSATQSLSTAHAGLSSILRNTSVIEFSAVPKPPHPTHTSEMLEELQQYLSVATNFRRIIRGLTPNVTSPTDIGEGIAECIDEVLGGLCEGTNPLNVPLLKLLAALALDCPTECFLPVLSRVVAAFMRILFPAATQVITTDAPFVQLVFLTLSHITLAVAPNVLLEDPTVTSMPLWRSYVDALVPLMISSVSHVRRLTAESAAILLRRAGATQTQFMIKSMLAVLMTNAETATHLPLTSFTANLLSEVMKGVVKGKLHPKAGDFLAAVMKSDSVTPTMVSGAIRALWTAELDVESMVVLLHTLVLSEVSPAVFAELFKEKRIVNSITSLEGLSSMREQLFSSIAQFTPRPLVSVVEIVSCYPGIDRTYHSVSSFMNLLREVVATADSITLLGLATQWASANAEFLVEQLRPPVVAAAAKLSVEEFIPLLAAMTQAPEPESFVVGVQKRPRWTSMSRFTCDPAMTTALLRWDAVPENLREAYYRVVAALHFPSVAEADAWNRGVALKDALKPIAPAVAWRAITRNTEEYPSKTSVGLHTLIVTELVKQPLQSSLLCRPDVLAVAVQHAALFHPHIEVLLPLLRHPHPDVRVRVLEIIATLLEQQPSVVGRWLCLFRKAETLDPLFVESQRPKISAVEEMKALAEGTSPSLDKITARIVCSNLIGLLYSKFTALSQPTVAALTELCKRSPAAWTLYLEHLHMCTMESSLGVPTMWEAAVHSDICSDGRAVFKMLWNVAGVVLRAKDSVAREDSLGTLWLWLSSLVQTHYPDAATAPETIAAHSFAVDEKVLALLHVFSDSEIVGQAHSDQLRVWFLYFLSHAWRSMQECCLKGLKHLQTEPYYSYFDLIHGFVTLNSRQLGQHVGVFTLPEDATDAVRQDVLLAVLHVAGNTMRSALNHGGKRGTTDEDSTAIMRFILKFPSQDVTHVVESLLRKASDLTSRRIERSFLLITRLLAGLEHHLEACGSLLLTWTLTAIDALAEMKEERDAALRVRVIQLLVELISYFPSEIFDGKSARQRYAKIVGILNGTTFAIEIAVAMSEVLLSVPALVPLLAQSSTKLLDVILFPQSHSDATLIPFLRILNSILDKTNVDDDLYDSHQQTVQQQTVAAQFVEPRITRLFSVFAQILKGQLTSERFNQVLQTFARCTSYMDLSSSNTTSAPISLDVSEVDTLLSMLVTYAKGAAINTSRAVAHNVVRIIVGVAPYTADPRALLSSVSVLFAHVAHDSIKAELCGAFTALRDRFTEERRPMLEAMGKLLRLLHAQYPAEHETHANTPDVQSRMHAWEYLLYFYKRCHKFREGSGAVKDPNRDYQDIALPAMLPSAEDSQALVHTVLHFMKSVRYISLRSSATEALKEILLAYTRVQDNHSLVEGVIIPVVMPGLRHLLGDRRPQVRMAALRILGIVGRSFGSRYYPVLALLDNITDPAKNFYELMVSPQTESQILGLEKLREVCKSVDVTTSRPLVQYLVPFLLGSLRNVCQGSERSADDVTEAAEIEDNTHMRKARSQSVRSILATLAAIAHKSPLKTYLDLLKLLLQNATKSNAMTDLMTGAVSQILESFPYEMTPHAQTFMWKHVIPSLQDVVSKDEKKLRVKVVSSLVTILKLLPRDKSVDYMVRQILLEVVTRLRTKPSEKTRDRARQIIVHVLQEFGFAKLFSRTLHHMKAVLKDGYQQHVLGYTLVDIFAQCRTILESSPEARKVLNKTSFDVMEILIENYFGQVSQEKEVKKLAVLKEVKRNRALEGVQFVCEFCVSGPMMTRVCEKMRWILSPAEDGSTNAKFLKGEKRAAADLTLVAKVRKVLQASARGLVANTTTKLSDILTFSLDNLQHSGEVHTKNASEFEMRHGNRRIRQIASQVQSARALVLARKTQDELFDKSFAIQPSAERRDVDFASTPTLLKNKGKHTQRRHAMKLKDGTITSTASVDYVPVLDVIDEFSLVLSKLFFLKETSGTAEGEDHREIVFDPLIKPLSTVIHHSASDDVVTAALHLLTEMLVLRKYASLPAMLEPLSKAIFSVIERGENIRTACYRVMAKMLRPENCTICDESVSLLTSIVHADIINHKHLQSALALLKVVVQRRYHVSEVYDIMPVLTERMLQSTDASVGNRCLAILALFLTDYKMSDGKLESHIDLLLRHLSYPIERGRESVLHLLYVILKRFPLSVLDRNVHVMFVPLVHSMTNDEATECRNRASLAVKTILEDDDNWLALKDLVQSWMSSDNISLRITACQASEVVFEALSARYTAPAVPESKGVAAFQALASSVVGIVRHWCDMERKREDGGTKTATKRLARKALNENWTLLYFALKALLRLFETAQAEYTQGLGILSIVPRCSTHPHGLVREMTAQLLDTVLMNTSALDDTSFREAARCCGEIISRYEWSCPAVLQSDDGTGLDTLKAALGSLTLTRTVSAMVRALGRLADATDATLSYAIAQLRPAMNPVLKAGQMELRYAPKAHAVMSLVTELGSLIPMEECPQVTKDMLAFVPFLRMVADARSVVGRTVALLAVETNEMLRKALPDHGIEPITSLRAKAMHHTASVTRRKFLKAKKEKSQEAKKKALAEKRERCDEVEGN